MMKTSLRRCAIWFLMVFMVSLIGLSCILQPMQKIAPTAPLSPAGVQSLPNAPAAVTPTHPPFSSTETQPLPNTAEVMAPTPSPLPPSATPSADKWSLWVNGTRLRGANIYQRHVFLEMDGPDFYGPGPFGPPYTQDDLNRLAALGANTVNISTAGLFTVQPPYVVDEEAVASLDKLLEMAAAADLFAVITFRTGPGRSEFAIIGSDTWPAKSYIINTVWSDASARQAWAAMWRFAAQRYRSNPIVIGYDLMCEPNANGILDIWDAETFYSKYTDTGYDWNSWYPGLVSAIREVDSTTPILVGGNNYSSVEWLSTFKPINETRIVYAIHQYSPHMYTHQEPPNLKLTYPGSFDTNYDGIAETFDRAWLKTFLATAINFSVKNHAPVVVNEFGAERWEPGAADYIRDEMDIFEQNGWNYTAWQWQPEWPPLAEGDNSFNFRFGLSPKHLTNIKNELLSAYTDAWARNSVRPSNFNLANSPLAKPMH